MMTLQTATMVLMMMLMMLMMLVKLLLEILIVLPLDIGCYPPSNYSETF